MAHAQAAYDVSERRALRASGFSRSSHRHRSKRDPQIALRMRLKELAAVAGRKFSGARSNVRVSVPGLLRTSSQVAAGLR